MSEKHKMSLKDNTIIALIVSIMVIATVIVLGIFKVSTVWPAFFIMIFFFLGGANIKNLPSIFAGSLFGILMTSGLLVSVAALTPKIGQKPALLLLIFIIIFLLVQLKDVVPLLFNDYAISYFTIALIYAQKQDPITWGLVTILGGTFLLGGVILLIKLCKKIKLLSM